MEEEVVGEHDGRDDGVFYGAAERELHHGFAVGDVGDEDARCVEQVDAAAYASDAAGATARTHVRRVVVLGRDDFDAAADFARDARLCAGGCDFSFADAVGAQGVEQRGLADVGHADNHAAVAHEFPARLGVQAEDVEDFAYGLARTVALVVACSSVSYKQRHALFAPAGYHALLCIVAGAAAEVALRVHDEALFALEGGLEQRVARGEGDAVVAALDDEVDAGEEGFHLGEAGFVVAEEVGAGERGERGEGMAGEEGHLRVVMVVVGVGWMSEVVSWDYLEGESGN